MFNSIRFGWIQFSSVCFFIGRMHTCDDNALVRSLYSKVRLSWPQLRIKEGLALILAHRPIQPPTSRRSLLFRGHPWPNNYCSATPYINNHPGYVSPPSRTTSYILGAQNVPHAKAYTRELQCRICDFDFSPFHRCKRHCI